MQCVERANVGSRQYILYFLRRLGKLPLPPTFSLNKYLLICLHQNVTLFKDI